MAKNWEVIQFFQVNIFKIENTICQQPFGKIASLVVNSRLRSARNIILLENKRLRSSQPRQAATRYASPYDDRANNKMKDNGKDKRR